MLPQEMLTICQPCHDEAGSKYYYIKISDGKSWLFPYASSRLLKLALAIYQPVGLKGWGFKLMFPYLASNRVFQRFIGSFMRVAIVDVSLRAEFTEWIHEVFHVKEPILSFYLGYPNIIRKSTCQVGDRELNILGYAKFSDESTGCEMIGAEAGFLGLYGDGKAGIPHRLAFRTDLLGLTILAQTTIKTLHDSRKSNILSHQHMEFLQQLRERTKVTMKYMDTGYYLNQQQYMETVLGNSTHEDRVKIRAAADIINSKLGDARVSFSVAHRDFKPPNICFADGRIMVFDWELVAYEYPPFYDIFSFVTFGWRTAGISAEKIWDAAENYMADLVIRYTDYTQETLELYYLMYQLDTTLLSLSLNPETPIHNEIRLIKEITKSVRRSPGFY